MNGGSTSIQAGRNADDLDLAGVGNATLECTVTQPIKENDGTKDAYVSYLVTTHVCLQEIPGKAHADSCRPLSRPLQSLPLLSAGALRISSSYTRH